MNIEKRYELISNVAEEIITKGELKELLEKKEHPVMYDGFEPSGLAHIPFGIYRALLLKDLLKAGLKVKLFLADWHAWINDKVSGDLKDIKKVGEYFLEVWKAAGVDMDKVEPVWASDLVKKGSYWKNVINIAKNHTLNRTERAMTIAGRKNASSQPAARVFYPSMQVADIFTLDVDICQLGMDQRRANMLAREVAPNLGKKKPIAVHHHMLMGLRGEQEAKGYDDNEKIDSAIASKMSKSKPSTCIYVHYSEEEIQDKINSAYCPEGRIKGNPIIDYAKEIIFRNFSQLKITRPDKYGGNVVYNSFEDLKNDYSEKELHPQDLKNAVVKKLNEMIKPIRKHFEEDKEAKKKLERVRELIITR